MRQMLVILDGAEESGGYKNCENPLYSAETPALDSMRRRGTVSKECFCPADMVPDSLICILTMLKVAKELLPEGRAYLEALAAGIPVAESECVLRCNVVSVEDGVLASFNGSGLEAAELCQMAVGAVLPDCVRLYHIGEYRNLLVTPATESLKLINKLPPHEHLGRSWTEMTEALSSEVALQQFAKAVRLQKGSISYMLYPWGVSAPCDLPTFESLHGMRGACVCSTPVVAGIATAMGMEVIVPEGATGDTDTDLTAKADAAIEAHRQYGWVVVHVNGTDEAAHRHDLRGKTEFIKRIDRELLRPILEVASNGTCITVTSDHRTGSRSGRHESGDVEVVRYVK